MALTKCSECGQQVSTKARTCPHCGAPSPGSGVRAALLPAVVALVAGLLVALTVGSANRGPGGEDVTMSFVIGGLITVLAVVAAMLKRRR